jgi:phosphoribosylaminoimidazole-succinocarboxamide synthase
MRKEALGEMLEKSFPGFREDELPDGVKYLRGKVRDIFDLQTRLLLFTSDRVSAFDRVLGLVPCKGEVLNRISLFWFDKTADIVENHLIERITPRTVLVETCDVLPVEVVVRGYLTGSAWRDYQAGKAISGITLPRGMRFNQQFDAPLITPSTKAERGTHDRPISSQEILASGIVPAATWAEMQEKSLALFRRGSKIAAANGLILVDTKYEFGLKEGRLVLVDEVHTPDSSRYWYADTYRELFEAGKKQRKIDKEYLRQWLIEQGYMGEGNPPVIPDSVRIELAWRYIQAFEKITGEKFYPKSGDFEAEKKKIISLLDKG